MTEDSMDDKQIALCDEMDAIIDLAHKAQEMVHNYPEFPRQVALLFHRIEVMAALKNVVCDET